MLQEKPNLSLENPFYGKWSHLVETIAAAFKLKRKERKTLHNSGVARLIAAIPFLAGCRTAARTAVTNLGIYIFMVRTHIPYRDKPLEVRDLLLKLRMMDNYSGGERLLINRGINLLTLNILSSYEKSIDWKELLTGLREEIFNGSFEEWEAFIQKDSLVDEITAIPSVYMDEVVTVREIIKEKWNIGFKFA